MKRELPVALLLVVATLVVFRPLTGAQFNNYDDPGYVTANPMVAGGLGWKGVRWAFTTYQMGNWHPLTWLSHENNVRFFGLNPDMHHAVSLLMHAVSAALLVLVMRRYTAAFWRGTNL